MKDLSSDTVSELQNEIPENFQRRSLALLEAGLGMPFHSSDIPSEMKRHLSTLVNPNHSRIFKAMKLAVKGINLDVSASLRDYVDEKLVRSVEKLLSGSAHQSAALVIELIHSTRHHKKGAVWEAAASLRVPGRHIASRASAGEMHAAIDEVEDVLKEELKKYKQRSRSRELRGARRVKKDIRLDRSARLFRKGRIRDEGV